METKRKEIHTNSFLTFKLHKEYFAVTVSKLLSILEMQPITEVPDAPLYMKGVINLRGEVLPIIDSHVKFDMPELVLSMNTCILVLEVEIGDESVKLGLLVDYVEEVIEILQKNILPPPGIGSSYKSKYVTGMYKKSDEQFVMILNIDKLLNDNEIISLHKEINPELHSVDSEETDLINEEHS